MSDNNEKHLPKDVDSDYSLPGRYEESNFEYNSENNTEFDEVSRTKTSGKGILVLVIVFMVFSAGFISYYMINQDTIDSKIIQNTRPMSPDQRLAEQFGAGIYGSDHSHAAIAVFMYGDQVNFGLPHFQLSSKYIHFENNNPYLIHKHANGVPLGMLFASFDMKVTENCITFNHNSSIETNQFCSGPDGTLSVYVNGDKYNSNISSYEISHNDRILISFGDNKSIAKQLAYLKSLKIFDVPKETPQYSGRDINL